MREYKWLNYEKKRERHDYALTFIATVLFGIFLMLQGCGLRLVHEEEIDRARKTSFHSGVSQGILTSNEIWMKVWDRHPSPCK